MINKPGKPAIVISFDPEFASFFGNVVTPKSRYFDDRYPEHIYWAVEECLDVVFLDRCLKPLEDPPEDAVDEMVLLCGNPHKQLEDSIQQEWKAMENQK